MLRYGYLGCILESPFDSEIMTDIFFCFSGKSTKTCRTPVSSVAERAMILKDMEG